MRLANIVPVRTAAKGAMSVFLLPVGIAGKVKRGKLVSEAVLDAETPSKTLLSGEHSFVYSLDHRW
jgi:hypothetical protein